MSTRTSGRSAATSVNDRSAVASRNGRSAAAPPKDRRAATHENVRAGSCSFTFADGRHCRTPLHSGHPFLCAFHARKEAQARAADDLGRDISHCFPGAYLSACGLSSALGRLFAATAKGDVKPKTAATLAYLGQTLVQTIQLAQHEYINAFGSDSWRKCVRSAVIANSDYAAQQHPHQDSPPQPSHPRPLQPALPGTTPQPSPLPQSRPTAPPPPSATRLEQSPPHTKPAAAGSGVASPSSPPQHPSNSNSNAPTPRQPATPATPSAPASQVTPRPTKPPTDNNAPLPRVRFPWEKRDSAIPDNNRL
jgi:hypothetical protein